MSTTPAKAAATASAVTAVVVIIIAGIIYTTIPTSWTGTVVCPNPPKKCRHDKVGNCAVLTGTCSGGLCSQALIAGAECAEGWTTDTGQTCDPVTCKWRSP
jgi:hypothetical protein